MKHSASIIALFILVCLTLCGCRQDNPISIPAQAAPASQSEDTAPGKPDTLQLGLSSYLPVDTGETHHALADARRFVIPGNDDARIAEMRVFGGRPPSVSGLGKWLFPEA